MLEENLQLLLTSEKKMILVKNAIGILPEIHQISMRSGKKKETLSLYFMKVWKKSSKAVKILYVVLPDENSSAHV